MSLKSLADAFKSLRQTEEVSFNWEAEAFTCTKCKLDKKYESTYEHNVIDFLKDNLPDFIYSIWTIRPKQETIEEEYEECKENNVNIANYHDERGAPAPAPWQNEKRVKINTEDPSKMKKPAMNCIRKMTRLLNELAMARTKLISGRVAIALPVRNENEVVEAVGILYSDMVGDQIDFKVGQIKLFNFGDGNSTQLKLLPIHYPSQASYSAFVRNANFYVDIENSECKLRSDYRPRINDCFFANISFRWTSDLRALSFLAQPDISNSIAQLHLEINPASNDWSTDVREASRQIQYMTKILNYLEDDSSSKLENDSLKSKYLDEKDLRGKIDELMAVGQQTDITPKLWTIGEKLSTDKLVSFITTVLRSISENGSSLVCDDDNDSSIGLKIQMAKRGRKSVNRRISELEALEILLECGRIYIDKFIMDYFSYSLEVTQLLDKYGNGCDNDPRSNTDRLRHKFSLCLLSDCIQKLDLGKSTTQRACETYLVKQSNRLQVELTLDNTLAWIIAKQFQPSVWALQLNDYQ